MLVTLLPLACITTSALGLTFGTIFDPRTVPLLFGIIILPLTFLGGTYYAWTTLSPVTVGSVHWLQILVLVNPLIYINEGFRAALTSSAHMTLWAVYPVLIGFSALFLWVGMPTSSGASSADRSSSRLSERRGKSSWSGRTSAPPGGVSP